MLLHVRLLPSEVQSLAPCAVLLLLLPQQPNVEAGLHLHTPLLALRQVCAPLPLLLALSRLPYQST
jgi:hypothetical protein